MWRMRKEALLLLFINSLHVHCRTVLKNQNVNKTDSFHLLKGNKWSECNCGPEGECRWKGDNIVCTCNDGYIHKDGTCTECYCGPNAKCSFEGDNKVCTCNTGYKKKEGTCTECNCGEQGWCTFDGDNKVCTCNIGYIDKDGTCTECNCGEQGKCTLNGDNKVCTCNTGYIDKDGICTECNCGEQGKCTLDGENKVCTCNTGYVDKDGTCTECDCGPIGVCHFEEGLKKCTCAGLSDELDGKCLECDCGLHGLCIFVSGRKKCICGPNYIESDGMCVADKFSSTVTTKSPTLMTTILMSTVTYCNCGENSISCRFNWRGDKICKCIPGYVENYGICVVAESSTLKGSTATRTTVLPSTTQSCNCGKYSMSCRFNWKGEKICDCFPGYVENYGGCDECDCGPLGRCTFQYGQKKCICDSLTAEKNGKCVECNCGKNTKSCRFDWKGNKICNCTSGFALMNGICKECNCGANVRNCFYRENGVKVCNCDFGYIETNGYCSSLCNEDKCIHGKCEIVGNGFHCRCNEGFTGQRCEEKVQTKSNKQNLWMVLQFSVVFATFILLSCMFCFWTRILNKMSKK